MKFITRLLLIILLPVGCYAQFTISGRVLNQADTRPVANASVFINNTTIGTKTDNDGNFKLRSLKHGKYQLIISIVGFDRYDQPITITGKDVILPDIVIFPKTIALNQVTIKPKTDAYRNVYFNWFKEQFLGKSNVAQDCKILNPELLDLNFDEATGTLTASSEDFLEIENPDLGYRIKYLLTNFTLDTIGKEIHYEGSVLFAELQGSPSQERRWQQRRQEAYEGSVMHFLRSALADRLDEEGFRVLQLSIYANPERPADSLIRVKIKKFESEIKQRDLRHYYENDKSADSLVYWKRKLKLPVILQALMPFPLAKADIITKTSQDGIVGFGCEGDGLLAMYNKGHHFPETKQLSDFNNLNYILNKPANKELTLLNFNGPYTFFDSDGTIVNPNSLVFKGAWGKNRVGDLLPVNYEPPQNKNAISESLVKNDTVLKATTAKLNTFTAGHPTEKVYLHLDKPHYALGDTIWFKAYAVIGEEHKLSALSRVLYAELINQKDSVVKRLTLPLIAGAAWGDFTIARSNKPGSYHIRAYTNWMRNAGPDYFYNQRIQVGGLQPSLAQAKQASALNPDVQFFPEGGQLVNGVRSRVAIKAVNSSGLGEDIKGTIEDNQGNVVADFATTHLGMGAFAFIPQSGKAYKAKINGTGEYSFTADLPKVMDEGYILALNNAQPDSIFIKVAVNEKVLDEQKNSPFYIVAQNSGKVYYTSESKLEGLAYTAKVDKARFPSGIVQFTLFSQSGEPLAERIAFIQNNDTLKLSLTSPAATYSTRQPVKIELAAKGNNGLPVTGNFSVAVINESRVGVDENSESTILNNLLLTSGLKGYIEQPNYYFTDVNGQSKAALDLLMLTQGYRSFEWKQVLNNPNQAITYQPERSLELSGTLKNPKGLPVPNGKITLVATHQNVLKDTITDANGNFKFDNLYLPDTAKLVIRARKENKESNVAIYVKQPDYPAIVKENGANAAQTLSSEMAALMQKDYEESQKQKKADSIKNGITLKEVKITSRLIHKPDVYNNYGAVSEYVVDMTRLDKEFIRIEDALTLVIPGLNGLDHHYAYENRPIKILIDGYPGTADGLNYFSPKEVESIRMISGTGLSSPTLLLTTKRYAGTDTVSTVKLKQVNIEGKKVNKGPDLTNSDNLNGPGHADEVIMGDKIEGCVKISDCLQGTVVGVKFDQYGVPYLVRTGARLGQSSGFPPPQMVLIVDGIIMDGGHLNDLNANEIYSIEVLRSAAYLTIYGSNAPGGAFVITTKRGGENNYATTETPSGIITYPFNGFYKARTFYTPKYNNPKTDAQTADLRNTIFWKPNIVTDKEGKASFEYFNNDTKGVYRIVVEGIDDDGNIGRQVYKYKVE